MYDAGIEYTKGCKICIESQWMKTGEFYFYLVKDLDQYLSCYSAYMKYKWNFNKCVWSFNRF